MHEDTGCKHHKEAQFWFFFAHPATVGEVDTELASLIAKKIDDLTSEQEVKGQQLETK